MKHVRMSSPHEIASAKEVMRRRIAQEPGGEDGVDAGGRRTRGGEEGQGQGQDEGEQEGKGKQARRTYGKVGIR